tara:strand:+ start:748 stop:1341 length:594 start_codon:yes stop_codon:yes gene_type:complete
MSIFWTDANRADPKRNYRFKLTITGIPGDALIWYAKSVTKPNVEISQTEHVYLNHKFYYPGRVEWADVTAVLVDPVSPAVVQTVMSKLEAGGYRIPRNTSDMTTVSKAGLVNQVLGVSIDQIDNVGNSVEHWELKNAWIKSVNFSTLDYESEDLSTVDVVFRYDWAECDGIFGAQGASRGGDSVLSSLPGNVGTLKF